ncbi:MAG: hypothetical protein JNM82_07470 [Rhodocyclaceae bacterium]|nr:hypothetical protein [Rhodocyclaceae bacterium]
METPLRFLRDWLTLGAAKGGDRAGEALRAWLEGLAGSPPEEMAVAIAKRLPNLVAAQPNHHMRLKLLDAFDVAVEQFLPELERQIAAFPLPLNPEHQATALAADNLLKALALAYGTVAVGIESRKLGSGLGQLWRNAAQRAMAARARRKVLAYRVYATPSPTSWRQMHRIYRRARLRGCAADERAGLSIEGIYVAALLFAFANPSKFSRQDQEAILGTIERFGSRARLREPTEAERVRGGDRDLFLIPADDESPGRPLHRVTASAIGAEGLILDCRELAAALRHEGDPAPAGLDPALADRLADMWSGQPTRRFTRVRFKPRSDLVSGLERVTRFIEGEALQRRRQDRPPAEGAVGAAAGGNGHDLGMSEWAIVNESPDSYGLRYLQGDPGRLDVGDLVGMRTRESARVHVCLIRRVSNAGQTRLELGVQELAPAAVPVEFLGSTPGEIGRGILLPAMPAHGGGPGLVAPPGSVASGDDVTLRREGRFLSYKAGRRLEGGPGLEVFRLEPPRGTAEPAKGA